jgi:anthranilate/para-aminobenzoate synthase component I
MLTQPPSTTPQQLAPVVREFVADALTPISAYLALATPGRSCLLESVEGTDRIARFSFIGLDYLESATFDGDPAMLENIRALIGKYRSTSPRVRRSPSRRRRLRVRLRRRARARTHRPEAAGRVPCRTRSSSCPERGSCSITSRTRSR